MNPSDIRNPNLICHVADCAQRCSTPPTAAAEALSCTGEHALAVEAFPELAELQALPGLSEEELERQALAHPGADGTPSTPE